MVDQSTDDGKGYDDGGARPPAPIALRHDSGINPDADCRRQK
jgi:hypothetical protein